jgi:hypothetical protein
MPYIIDRIRNQKGERMNLRIETDDGQVVLKISAHHTDTGKALFKVPVGCETLKGWVGKFCVEFGVDSSGNSWAGKTYWMQEVDRGQALAAVGQLLQGKLLPPIEYPPVSVLPETLEEDEDGENDDGGSANSLVS